MKAIDQRKEQGLSVRRLFFLTTLMLTVVAFSWGFVPGVHAKSKKAAGAQPAQTGQTTDTTPKQPEKESPLKTEREKVNYAIGVNLIGNIKRQGVEIDLDLVMKGMKDAYSGGELLLSDGLSASGLNLVSMNLVFGYLNLE